LLILRSEAAATANSHQTRSSLQSTLRYSIDCLLFSQGQFIHPSSHTDHHRHRLRLSFVSKNIYTPHFHLHTRITMTTTTSPGSILTTIGTLLILHSTYSCLHYRSLAMAADLPLSITSSPPLDVVMEVLVGFGMCLVGQLMMCGPFHEVRIASSKNDGGKRREIVPPAYRSRDFDLFTTRAKLLSVAIGQGAQ